MKRVLLIAIHWLEIGGAEKFIVDTIKYAYAEGWSIFCWVEQYKKSAFYYNEIKDMVQEFYYAKEPKESAKQFESLVKTINPQVLHIQHSKSAYLSLSNIYHYVPRIVDTTHIVEHHYNGGFPYLSVNYSPFIDRHHVISKGLRDYYVQRGINDRKIKLGFLCQKYSQAETNRATKSGKDWVLGFLGRFEEQKRPELFIELAYRLKELPYKFVMKGEGSRLSKCKLLAEELNIENIKFYRATTDVSVFLDEVDILILPSKNEGLALVNYEAAQKQVLIVSSNVGQQSELTAPICLINSNKSKWLNEAEKLLSTLTANKYSELIKWQSDRLKYIQSQPNKNDFLHSIYSIDNK